MSNKIAIVALRYLEPYYAETERCLWECRKANPDRISLFWATRDGVGSMPRAFNDVFKRHVDVGPLPKFKKVWFVTDILFSPYAPLALAQAMDDHGLVAIQPAYGSDHHFLRPDGSSLVKEVPYLEFTAAMVDVEAYSDVGGLDEDYWFWHHDLVISQRLRVDDNRLGVHHGVQIDHSYRGRNGAILDPLTAIRYRLRDWRDPIEKRLLADRFGPNWKDILWCKGEQPQ